MDDPQKIKLDDVAMTPFLKKVTLFSSGGPFLEGYVLGIIGVALVKMIPELGINDNWSGLIGVAALVGLFVGGSVGGWVTDMIGRRKMFVIDLIMIAVLSLLCMIINTPLELFVLRFFLGVAIGADYPIATSMIVEFTPRRYRAISMGFIAAVWYVGANMAYLVGFLLLDVADGWRWMLGSSVVPCVIILLGRLSVPESPRWLISKGRYREAKEIVVHLFGAHVTLKDEGSAIPTKLTKVFHGIYFKRVIFISVIWLCQAVPMFGIYTFGPQIIDAFGFGKGGGALLGEIVIGLFFFIGTIPAMFLAESWGRRPLIISCFFVMTISLLVLGLLPSISILAMIGCFAIYALFSGGPGNLEWLYPNELFPTDIRASAMGIALAISRIGTVFSIYVLPAFIENHGIGPTMLAGAGISLFGLLISVIWAPETRGLSLNETCALEFRGR